MTIQATDIINSVRRRLRQTTQSLSNWQDDDLMVYLNSAVRQVARETRCHRTFRKYSGNGGSKYPLPGDLITADKVTGPGGVIPWITVSDTVAGSGIDGEFAELIMQGPVGCIVRGDSLYILPSLADGDIRYLHYVGYPATDLTSSSASYEMPMTTFDALVYRTCADCCTELGQTQKIGIFEQKYATELEKVMSAEASRQFPGPNKLRRPRLPRR